MNKTLAPINGQTTGKRFRRENWRTSSLGTFGILLRCEIDMLRRLTGSTALAITLLTLARPLSAQNLVINGGFETLGPTPWTFAGACFNTSHSNSGAYALSVTGTCTASQAIVTDFGQNYDLSFWLSGDFVFSNYASFFQAVWGGTQVVAFNSSSPFTYTLYQLNNLAAASGPTTTLELTLSTNNFTALDLDDVSVTLSQSTVPEPGSLTLLAAGIGALAAAGRLRKRAKA